VTAIARPAQSALDSFDPDQQHLFETLAGILAGEPSWKQRRLTFLKIIEKLKRAFERVQAEPDSNNLPFMALLPMQIGAVLEKLDETEMEAIEQAAFYLLSIHPEHQQAADTWLQSDKANIKSFSKFVEGNPFYAALYRSLDHYAGSFDDA